MIRRSIHFFKCSIRNKLMVALPLIVAFVILFAFTLMILSLRQNILSHDYTSLDELLFSQTLALAGAGIVVVISVVVSVASLGRLISDPLCRLADEAARMVTEESSVKQLSFAHRQDEVGLLARQMNTLLEKTAMQSKDAAIGKIATHIAHDIRSPLSSIQQAVGLLRSSGAPKEDALNLLDLGAQRLTNIANGLLERHKDGEARKMVFSLHKVLDELVGELKSSPNSHDIKIIKQYDSALSCYGDRTRVMRAFGNILKNASEALRSLDFAQDSGQAMNGSGSITIRTIVEGEYSVTTITDNGPGMNAETLAKILKGGHSSGKQDGHGIGMKVVREVIESHLGILEGQSILGQGTTFTIKLPLPGSSILKNAEAVEQGVGVFELGVSGHEVLVVDDDAGMRLQWELLLKREGIKVYSFDSGESYLKNKPKESIQTGIIDFHFENSPLNGIDILKGLKEENYTHLTLCTAEYWKPGLQEEAKSLGVRICPKPLPRVIVRIPPHPPFSKGGIAAGLPPLTKGERGGFEDGYRVLVIDDDPLIRTTWKLSKKLLKIKDLYAFESFEVFSRAEVDPSLVDMAFVDKNIEGSQLSGEETMAKLNDLGYKNLTLKTGEQGGSKIPDSLDEYLK